MSLSLSALTKYKDIVVQCHDNPDADAYPYLLPEIRTRGAQS